jgi:16S rRNA pseudouridine516 synthase
LLAGVKLIDEDEPIAAVSAQKRGDNQIEIVLEQGKYHQVKRMLAAAGNHCAALSRVAIGDLQLSDLDLAAGEWRFLTEAELQILNK